MIGLKAHAIAAMLPRIAPLVGADTAVVPAINGVPWWYFHAEGGPLAAPRCDRSILPTGCSRRLTRGTSSAVSCTSPPR